jgi:hypothetical protein
VSLDLRAGTALVNFGPRDKEEWRTDPSWCLNELQTIGMHMEALGSQAWSKARNKGAPPLGWYGGAGIPMMLTIMSLSLRRAEVDQTCPHIRIFNTQVPRLQAECPALYNRGYTDVGVWAWVTQEVIKIFMGKRPTEFTSELQHVAVRKGTLFSEGLALMAARVQTSASVHPDRRGSKAHNIMRSDAVVLFFERHYPTANCIPRMRRLHAQGAPVRDLLREAEAERDVNLVAVPLPDDQMYVYLNKGAKKQGEERAPAHGGGGGGNGGTGGDGGGSRERGREHDRRDHDRRHHRDHSSSRERSYGTPSKQHESRGFRKLYALAVVAMEQRPAKPCHNCGTNGHYWLTCPKSYNKQRWEEAVKNAGSDTRLARIAPRTEKYFQDMQAKFAARNRNFKPNT